MQPLFEFDSYCQLFEFAILYEISLEHLCLHLWLRVIFVDELNYDFSRFFYLPISTIFVSSLHTLEVKSHCDFFFFHLVGT